MPVFFCEVAPAGFSFTERLRGRPGSGVVQTNGLDPAARKALSDVCFLSVFIRVYSMCGKKGQADEVMDSTVLGFSETDP